MDSELLNSLWLVLKVKPLENLLALVGIVITIFGAGFGIGRWSAKHTLSDIKAQNTILNSKLELLSHENSSYAELREEIAFLKEEAEKPDVDTLHYKDGLYYHPKTGVHILTLGHEKNDGPFCPRCWEVDRVKVSLQKNDLGWRCINTPCSFFSR